MERDPNDSKVMIHLEYIRGSVDQINGRLDILNGKTNKHAQDIAVLYDRDLERDRDAKRYIAAEAKKHAARWSGVTGALGASLAAAWQYLSSK